MSPRANKTQRNNDKRPPLGPDARKNLGVFGLITGIHTLATVIFSAALASLIARAAQAGFIALTAEHEHLKAASDPETYRALIEFSGNSQAKLDSTNGWLLGLGNLLGTGNAITWGLIVTALIALAVRAGADYALSVSAQRAAVGAKASIRQKLVHRVLATGGADTPEGTGATAVLLARGLNALDDYYTKTLTAFVSVAIVPVLLWLIVLSLDITSALVLACTLPLIPIFMILIGKTTREDTAAAQAELHRLSDHILELIRGLPVLIGLGRERAQTRALRKLGEQYRERTMQTLRSAFMSSLALELITTISVALIAVLIGVRLVQGTLGLDTAILVLLLAPECYQPLRDVGAAYHQSEDGIAALRSVRTVLDTPVPEASADASCEKVSTIPETPEHLVIENLSVTYPGRTQILDSVNLNIPRTSKRPSAAGKQRGALVSILGPSGCGKSTLLGVLSGSVRDGLTPTGASEPITVTGRITGTGSTLSIPQNPVFAAPTVLHEMALYAFSADRSEEEYAAKLLTGKTQIRPSDRERLENYLWKLGLENLSELSPESLSAGQARRLACARILARIDALHRASEQHQHLQITVLVDEPTAHLDAHAAHLVAQSLDALAERGVTVLIVTHETELTEYCDSVVSASVVVEGAHAEPSHEQVYRWSIVQNEAPKIIPAAAPHKQDSADTFAEYSPTLHKAPEKMVRENTEHTVGVVKTLKTLRNLTGLGILQGLPPVILAALTSLAAISLTALSGWLIVRAAEGPAMMFLMVAIVGVRFFGLGRACARYAERLLTHAKVLTAANTLRVRAWTGAYLDIGSVRALLRGDTLLERLIGGIDELRDSIPRVLIPPAAHALVMVTALITTIVVLPQAIVPVALAALITTILVPWAVTRADAHAEETTRESTAELLRLGTGVLSAAEDIRANGVAPSIEIATTRLNGRNVAALTRTSYAQGLGRALVTLSWFGAALWCAIIAYPLAISGTVGAPESAAVVLMCTAMIESSVQHIEAVRSWSSFATLLAQIAPGIADENSVSDLEEQDTSHVGCVREPQGQEPALELVDAAARWPSMDKPVFEHLNATAHTGKWTGITGPSGSGKSTVLAALLGFLPLEAGEVRSHGKALGKDQLRGYAAWCPQAAHIFESTLEGNLLLARDRADRPSEEQMIKALQRVGLGEWYSTLPEGLHTRVGAGGGFLSGGQRQRLAVARALLVESPVLLLDEPTAHLDSESAAALMADLDTATRTSGMATVLVSHRPEDIARCDTVVTLE
ncbi:thiol reductant ABC exporter subunit CydC [Rothia dentocariosa]|uniref:thiol reductant ABC exporter subunit CydC n=1 Tax=Rothia dentocariosa TaxID=2047 RepID=UPI000A5E340D|nr:thiol reductant ABC exporter subunit CydC [Rothia dentocariosa]